MSDYSKSVARTVTPIAVGYVVALALKAGFNVTSAQVIAVLSPVVAVVYYVVVRGLEDKFPFLGYFLGHPSKPDYKITEVKSAPTKAPAPAPAQAPTPAPVATKMATPQKTQVAKKSAASKSSTSAPKKSTK
jgi:hypothetical protein